MREATYFRVGRTFLDKTDCILLCSNSNPARLLRRRMMPESCRSLEKSWVFLRPSSLFILLAISPVRQAEGVCRSGTPRWRQRTRTELIILSRGGHKWTNRIIITGKMRECYGVRMESGSTDRTTRRNKDRSTGAKCEIEKPICKYVSQTLERTLAYHWGNVDCAVLSNQTRSNIAQLCVNAGAVISNWQLQTWANVIITGENFRTVVQESDKLKMWNMFH